MNEAIKNAKAGDPLRGIEPVVDPSDDIIESLILTNRWNMLSRQKEIPVDKLPEVESLGKELMESLKHVFPERTGRTSHDGEIKGWCFEKFHSIRHTARNILLFGNLEGTSAQGPERCHIDLVKQPALMSNKKQMMACIMNFHSRMMKLHAMTKHYKRANEITSHNINIELDQEHSVQLGLHISDEGTGRIHSDEKQRILPCEIGMRYPYLLAGQNKEQLHTRAAVMCTFA